MQEFANRAGRGANHLFSNQFDFVVAPKFGRISIWILLFYFRYLDAANEIDLAALGATTLLFSSRRILRASVSPAARLSIRASGSNRVKLLGLF